MSIFTKLLLGVFINFFIFQPLSTKLDKFTTVLVFYVALTLLIFTCFYLYAGIYCSRINYPKGFKQAFLMDVPGRFNDNINYYPEDMPKHWITDHFFEDINT